MERSLFADRLKKTERKFIRFQSSREKSSVLRRLFRVVALADAVRVGNAREARSPRLEEVVAVGRYAVGRRRLDRAEGRQPAEAAASLVLVHEQRVVSRLLLLLEIAERLREVGANEVSAVRCGMPDASDAPMQDADAH